MSDRATGSHTASTEGRKRPALPPEGEANVQKEHPFDRVRTPLPDSVLVEQVTIPMREGIQMAGTVFRPSNRGVVPVVTTSTSYGNNDCERWNDLRDAYDVAIIGYGLTGLVLASALGRLGHSVIVIERWPGLYGLPRVTHIDGETARIVQSVADVDTALRDAISLESYRYLDGAGELLVELDWSGMSSGYPAHIGMYQPDVEDAIDDRARSYPRVEVNQGCAAVAVHQDGDGVMVTFRPRPWRRNRRSRTGQRSQRDEVRTNRARYLVGADGGNSFVRTNLGITCSDLGVEERWLILDTQRLHPLPAGLDRPLQFCDPDRGHIFLPVGKRRQRFEVSLLPHEEEEDVERPDFA